MVRRLWLETTFLLIVGMLLAGCGSSQKQLSTQTAIASTATFEALPTSTTTRTPTDMQTSTVTPTKTPIPTNTETVTPTNFPANWKDEFFIPVEKKQELQNKGSIFLGDLPVEQWKDLKVTGPGQVYAECNGKRMKDSMPKTSYLGRIQIDRKHYGKYVCYVKAATEQQLHDFYKNIDPSIDSEKIQRLSKKYIELSKEMYSQIPNDYFYLDAYVALMLWIDPKNINNANWILLGVSNEDNSPTTYIKTIPIP